MCYGTIHDVTFAKDKDLTGPYKKEEKSTVGKAVAASAVLPQPVFQRSPPEWFTFSKEDIEDYNNWQEMSLRRQRHINEMNIDYEAQSFDEEVCFFAIIIGAFLWWTGIHPF